MAFCYFPIPDPIPAGIWCLDPSLEIGEKSLSRETLGKIKRIIKTSVIVATTVLSKQNISASSENSACKINSPLWLFHYFSAAIEAPK